MPLTSGTRLGPYEILEPIGKGGMGEVYKAKDTRLDRTVAIKILPEQFANSPERKARFEREARAISQLNHPHICTLYDVGSQDGIEYLVMEYIDGETLADRLKRGALPLDKALEYGIQIAHALDKAHRAGIVHRDLKPSNVMLTKSGVKLLDFGLASLVEDPIFSESSSAPTLQKDITREHAILGTLQYMAPEQLEGKGADARTDIFAFGTVFYEMVTGQRAFSGRSQVSIIAAILDHDPSPISNLKPMTPSLLDRAIKRSLSKDPEERWQSARDLSSQLMWIAEGIETPTPAPIATTRSRVAWGLVALAAVATGTAVWNLTHVTPAATQRFARLDVAIPEGQSLSTGLYPSLALTRDGTRLVFQAQADGVSQLHLRSMDQFEPRPVSGTEGAHTPFTSPDGRWIGFMANSQLKRVSITGGPPLTLCAAPSLSPGSPGAAWGPDDTIIFAAGISGLMRVSATGGKAETLTTPDPERGEINHFGPQFLPGGKHVLFSIRTNEDEFRIAVLSLETLDWKWLRRVGEAAGTRYVPTGHLVFAQSGALWAVPFDLTQLELSGVPFPLLEDVYSRVVADAVVAQFAISDDGVLTYVSGEAPEQSLVLVDRAGRANPLLRDSHTYRYPRFSATSGQVAVGIETERSDIYVVDVQRRTLRRLTRTGSNIHPTWTLDGQKVTFASRRTGSDAYDIYWVPADESGEVELLMTSEASQFPSGWSPDGKILAFYEINNDTARDIWTVSLDGERSPFAATGANERVATFSADGNWLAYVSDESGRDEIYVRRYPGPGAREVISSNGGTEPVWSADGREIFYRKGNQMLAVAVQTEPTFVADAPRVLFEEPYVLAAAAVGRPNYDVGSDGRTFVMIRNNSDPRHLHVVLNWFEELERLDPTTN